MSSIPRPRRTGTTASGLRLPHSISRWIFLICIVVLIFLFLSGIAWFLPWVLVTALPLSTTEQYRATTDIRSGVAQAFTALGVVSTLLYAARGFRINQDAHLTGRFESAAKQIAGDNEAVRIAGLYAMGLIADIWPQQRQACIEVICSYIRRAHPLPDNQDPFKDSRETALNIIADRLRADSHITWFGHQFNLSGAVIGRVDFSRTVPTKVRLDFTGSTFIGLADFSMMEYADAVVRFDKAVFDKTSQIHFDGSRFLQGTVAFDGALFEAESVSFDHCSFHSECDVTFAETQIGDCSLTLRSVRSCPTRKQGDVKGSGGGLSLERAQFLRSTVCGEVILDRSTFSSRLSLRKAKVSKNLSFKDVTFSSVLDFREAEFGANVFFEAATSCRGRIDLTGYVEKGGKLDLRGMKGTALSINGVDATNAFNVIMNGSLPFPLEPVTDHACEEE